MKILTKYVNHNKCNLLALVDKASLQTVTHGSITEKSYIIKNRSHDTYFLRFFFLKKCV